MERVVNGPSLGQQDIYVLSQLKGQILVFSELSDIKQFLSELIEEEENEV